MINHVHRIRMPRGPRAIVAAVLILFAVSGICAIVSAKSGSGLAGFISSVHGKAAVQRGTKAATLDGMNSLRAGDVVHVGPKSTVVVNLCGQAQRIKVQGAAVFSVTPAGLRFTKGTPGQKAAMPRPVCETLMESTAKYDHAVYAKGNASESAGAMSVMGFISSKTKQDSAMRDVISRQSEENGEMMKSRKSIGDNMDASGGGISGSSGIDYDASANAPSFDDESSGGGGGEEKIFKPNPVYIDEPMKEKSVLSRPQFTWDTVYGAVSYDVAITNAVNVKVFETKTSRAYLDYPNDAAPLLAGGWYLCEITPRDENGNEVGGEVFGLAVRNAEEQKAFAREESALRAAAAKDPGDPGALLLLGRFYESNGMVPAAVDVYTRALALDPKNTALSGQLDALKQGL